MNKNEQELSKEIEKSNVICLVYSICDDHSKEHLATYWLPKIIEIEEALCKQEILTSTPFNSNLTANELTTTTRTQTDGTNVVIDDFHQQQNKSFQFNETKCFRRPIILVANKSDTTPNSNIPIQDSFIQRLVSANSQIESYVYCSAKNLKNVPEVFYYAQKSVLYPTLPVYDNNTTQLNKYVARKFY